MSLELYIKQLEWADSLQHSTHQQLSDIVETARRVIASGGHFIIEGDASLPTADIRISTPQAFSALITQVNAGLQALGKPTV